MKRCTLYAVLLAGASGFLLGCPDNEGSCDPDTTKDCHCFDRSDYFEIERCEDSFSGRCICYIDPNFEERNTSPQPSFDPQPVVSPTPVDPFVSYRYLLIEDLTFPVGGEFPGLDLDFVELTKFDGTVHYVSSVVDFNVGIESNSAIDPSQIIGAPDANCDPQSGAFLSLGGLDENGYIMVSFGDFEEVPLENGDVIIVGEIGATLCGGMFDDDIGSVSISVGTDLGSFITVGEFVGASEINLVGL